MALLRPTGDAELDAFIAFEVRYNQTRWAEIWLACKVTLAGIIFLIPGSTFGLADGYTFFATAVGFMNPFPIPAEIFAGFIAVAVGLTHLTALWYNGSRRRSPMYRMLACMMGGLFWGALAYGFMTTTPTSNAVGLIVGLFFFNLIASLHSSSRAARDAVAYMRYKPKTKFSLRRDSGTDDLSPAVA